MMLSYNLLTGLLAAIGGYMGYYNVKSVTPLATGLLFAVLYFVSNYLIHTGKPVAGHNLALIVSLVLSGVTGSRASQSGKFYPAGFMAVVALGTAFLNFLGF
eukprot:m.30413 g.30413  ORF g.30413 m.30413 type:complete len:102 (-) comp10572_c0_seq1:235-540(-)